jgi:hypothetical protein|tara:strand:- start:1563 stop:1952 length:390 start_codon:yes stop_codon:yes gene_type:complete
MQDIMFTRDEITFLAYSILRNAGEVHEVVTDELRIRLLSAYHDNPGGSMLALSLWELRLFDELITPAVRSATLPSGKPIVPLWEKFTAALVRETHAQDADRDAQQDSDATSSGSWRGAGAQPDLPTATS